jgi:drug/metabolite transporter (DMT)-like permease
VAWVVLERPNADDPSHAPHHKRRGVALALFATFANAIGVIFSRLGIGNYDAVAATQIRVLASLLGYVLVITLWRRWPVMFKAAHHPRAMSILTSGAIVGPFVGVTFFMIALRHSPSGVVTTVTASMPVLIVPFSIFLYHEKVSLRAVGGAIVALAGVAMLMLPQDAEGGRRKGELPRKPQSISCTAPAHQSLEKGSPHSSSNARI